MKNDSFSELVLFVPCPCYHKLKRIDFIIIYLFLAYFGTLHFLVQRIHYIYFIVLWHVFVYICIVLYVRCWRIFCSLLHTTKHNMAAVAYRSFPLMNYGTLLSVLLSSKHRYCSCGSTFCIFSYHTLCKKSFLHVQKTQFFCNMIILS
jgi:hypothetical protein